MKKDKVVPIKRPPKDMVKSVQLDLFSSFVTNQINEVSNTVKIWERIPKYFPARVLEKLRTNDGLAQPYEWEYIDGGVTYSVVIQPALIKEEGGYKAYFPSTTEELIEEVLKKILTIQKYGTHDPKQAETWVKFSLSMIYRELNAKGCSRSRVEIKRAISIMSKCNLSFFKDGKEVWNGSILQDLVTIGRDEYLEDTDSMHAARLPIFISKAINNLDYRQFNYERLMNCKSQLTRWIYKRLVHEYKQAHPTNTYHFMYSDLKASGLLQQGRETDIRKKVIAALDELQSRNVLMSYLVEDKKEERSVIDVKYIVAPSMEFSKEQIASNKRAKDTQQSSLLPS